MVVTSSQKTTAYYNKGESHLLQTLYCAESNKNNADVVGSTTKYRQSKNWPFALINGVVSQRGSGEGTTERRDFTLKAAGLDKRRPARPLLPLTVQILSKMLTIRKLATCAPNMPSGKEVMRMSLGRGGASLW